MATPRSVGPAPELQYFDSPKRVRAVRDGRTLADSRRVRIVWPKGAVVPIFAFPREDVVVEAAAVKGLDGYVTLPWDAADEWLEEEEHVHGHARDPFKRIDARRSARRVVVEHEGEVLADSARPVAVFETGLPTRWYLPREDVRMDRLEASPTRTVCAYKGVASHFAHGGVDVAWSYPEPLDDAPPVRDLIAFYDERVDVTVDGEPQERPRTPWA